MPNFKQKPLHVIIALLSLGATHVSPVAIQSVQAAEKQSTGTVSLYALQNGLPMKNIQVFHGDKRIGQTDSDGAFTVRLPVGKQSLSLKSKQSALTTLKLNIAKDDDIELIVPITKQAKVSDLLVESALVENPIIQDENQKEDDETVKIEGVVEVLSIIKGTIYSLETGEGIPEANIYLTGYGENIKTNDDGYFEAKVPIGSYALSVIHPDYSATTVKGLEVKEGIALEQELELTPAAAELEEFIVSAPALEGGILAVMAEKQNSSGVAEVISSEEFSKSGDSSAASALSRVTGLTLVDGKYIYVRGMGDRYSATRLNGAGLPSPEPSKRVVPLDMFPTGMIGSIKVQKTYSPDLPGEFGGGSVLLRTKPIPLEKHRKISISTGGNSQATFQDRLGYEGSTTDILGIDDGSREIPAIAENYISNPPEKDSSADRETKKNIGKQFVNQYKTSKSTLYPDTGFKISLGDRYESYDGDSGWGYNLAINYGNKSRYLEEVREDFFSPRSNFSPELERKYKTKYSTNLGVMAGLIYELGENHKLDAMTLITRSSSDTVSLDTSYSSDNENNFKQYTLQWEERQLLSQQFHGTHVFPDSDDLEIEWQTTLSLASRESPDTRIYAFQQSANHNEDTGLLNDYQFQYRGDGNQRMWEDLQDFATSTTVDITQPIYDLYGYSGSLKTGMLLETKNRTSDTYKFSWNTSNLQSTNPELLTTENPEEIFVPENIDSGAVSLNNTTQPTDSYVASQTITALYAMGDIKFSKYLKAMAGGRYESSDQTVEVFNNAQRTEKKSNSLSKTFILPAINFTVPYRKGEQLRFGYSQTINRPDLKELSASTYIDPDTRDYYIGNPDLEIAEIQNIDFRWEKYINSFENISIALFTKSFTSPIEEVIVPTVAEGVTYYSYANVKSATNTGIEFQSRFWLRRIFGNLLPAMYLDTNFSIIDSKVDMSGVKNNLSTNTERALQGQAPWVVNLNLGYENLIKEINANLLLNVQGDSIDKAGTKLNPDADFGVEDTYLVAPPSLNFVYNQRVYWGAEDKLKLKIKLDNLLDGEYKLRILDQVQKSYKKGISANISLTYTWK